MTLHIGFTGASRGMTEAQHLSLGACFRSMRTADMIMLHHGDCVGADTAAHNLAVMWGIQVHIHPPQVERARAHNERLGWAWRVSKPLPYRARNQAIVDACSLLIATPWGPEASYPRSGTWMTVRMARKAGREIWTIWPDGQITKENFK